MRDLPFNTKDLELLKIIDCTKDLPFESHPTHVVHGKAGTYREGDPKWLSRFAYKFEVEDVQKPHLAVISYPDDKPRNICVGDGFTYDLSSGIGTGFDLPLSGKIARHAVLFWPRFKQGSILFINHSHEGDDAFSYCAIQKIEIYKFKSGTLPLPPVGSQEAGFRRIGFQWEDPCGKLASFGARNISEWAERLASYAAFARQKVVEYPATWYWGPLYPSAVETPNFPHNAIDTDGKFLQLVIDTPSDWLGDLSAALARKGIEFKPVVHLLRLSSLVELGVKELAAGIGKDSVFNVRSDGQPQTSTFDWTRFWNDKVQDGPVRVGHEDLHAKGPAGPIYNPLHPAVRAALLRLFKELGARYGRQGATVPLWGTTFLWFSSLKFGYDDLSAGLFEKETGFKVSKVPAAGRYDWVKLHCLEAWIKWRCAKVKELLDLVAESLGAPLTISVCHEPLLTHLYDFGASLQDMPILPGKSLYELCREGGLDFELYKTGPVRIELQLNPSRSRSFRTALPMLYDEYNNLDFKTVEKLSGMKVSNYLFNCYFESVSYNWRKMDKESIQGRAFGTGRLVELQHLYFPHEKWALHKNEFTTSPGVPPAGRRFLQAYAHALAEYDSQEITHGGLCVGTFGHERELIDFSKVFTAIPEGVFKTVGKSCDPVAVRTNGEFLYVVNQAHFPVEADLKFASFKGSLLRLPMRRKMEMEGDRLTLKLKPYGLLLFKMEGLKVKGFEVRATGRELAKFKKESDALLATLRPYLATMAKCLGNSGRRAIDELSAINVKYCETLMKIIEDAERKDALAKWWAAFVSLRFFAERNLGHSREREANQRRFEDLLKTTGRAAISCGSTQEFVDENGKVWLPDQKYSVPEIYGNTGAEYTSRDKIEGLPKLHHTEAHGWKLCYRLPAPEGNYRLLLHFAETWHRKEGQRSFKLKVDGVEQPLVMKPFERGGGFAKPSTLSFETAAKTGKIDVELFGGDAIINGIELEVQKR